MTLRSRSIIETIRAHLTGKCNQETVDQLVNILEVKYKQDVFSFINIVDKSIENFTVDSFDYAKYNKKNDSFLFCKNGLEYKPNDHIYNLTNIVSGKFTMMDKTLFVNMDNICSYDSYYQIINFFGVETKEVREPLRVTHASMKQVIICKGKELDLHNESDTYSPLLYRRKEFT